MDDTPGCCATTSSTARWPPNCCAVQPARRDAPAHRGGRSPSSCTPKRTDPARSRPRRLTPGAFACLRQEEIAHRDRILPGHGWALQSHQEQTGRIWSIHRPGRSGSARRRHDGAQSAVHERVDLGLDEDLREPVGEPPRTNVACNEVGPAEQARGPAHQHLIQVVLGRRREGSARDRRRDRSSSTPPDGQHRPATVHSDMPTEDLQPRGAHRLHQDPRRRDPNSEEAPARPPGRVGARGADHGRTSLCRTPSTSAFGATRVPGGSRHAHHGRRLRSARRSCRQAVVRRPTTAR